MTVQWSLIVVTSNDNNTLETTLLSLIEQDYPSNLFEIIVIGSTQNIENNDIVQALCSKYPEHSLRFISASDRSLLAGQLRGIAESQAEILTFFSDDITIAPNFAKGIQSVFSNLDTTIAVGPIQPDYEISLPTWIKDCETFNDEITALAPLGILDYGNRTKNVDISCISGLNFSIRKSALMKLEGLCPNACLEEMGVLGGNAISNIAKNSYRFAVNTIYEPQLRITKYISATKLQKEYFTKTMFNSGIAASYEDVRMGNIAKHAKFPMQEEKSNAFKIMLHNAYVEGYLRHHLTVLKNHTLLEWVTRPSYLNNSISPDFSEMKPINIRKIATSTLADIEEPLLKQVLSTACSNETQTKLQRKKEYIKKLLNKVKIYNACKKIFAATSIIINKISFCAQLQKEKNNNKDKAIANIYDDVFYAEQAYSSYISARHVLAYIDQIFPNINKVADIGCGVGTWLKAWQDMKGDHMYCIGFDGNVVEDQHLYIPREQIKILDFTQPYEFRSYSKKFDLVESLEVAEHIPEEKARQFVKILTSLSDIVLFSAALPGQGGTNHVNEQIPEYWNLLFKEQSYICFDIVRPSIWNESQICSWYKQNTLLFLKKEKAILLESQGFTSSKIVSTHKLTEHSPWNKV